MRASQSLKAPAGTVSVISTDIAIGRLSAMKESIFGLFVAVRNPILRAARDALA
jgi:hypothetical protein